MYRATLIFSYSFSLSGYYTYFWYPIPLSQLCLGYFLSISASIPFLPLRPGIFCTFRPLYPFSRCALGIFCTFRPLYPFSRCALGISYPFRPPYSSCRCARVFLALSGFSYPRNTEILCMSFSYNTQDSIGKRFPQPFL